jgi:hypothetical protein
LKSPLRDFNPSPVFAMHYYRLHGGCLASEVELSGLARQTASISDWRLVQSAQPRTRESLSQVGEHTTGSTTVTLFRSSSGYRLLYSDTGCYSVSTDGRKISWTPGIHAPPEAVRSDVAGAVLAVALLSNDAFSLHASAVTIDGRCVALAAPSGFGKSTTALACVQAGARLVTDDMLAIDAHPLQNARPGVQVIRLLSDAHADYAAELPPASSGTSKTLIDSLPPERICAARTTLSAVYILHPVQRLPGGVQVSRIRLSAAEAIIALVANAKLGPVMQGPEGGLLLRQAARVAARAQVFELRYVRGLDRLPAVARQLVAWHSVAATGSRELRR